MGTALVDAIESAQRFVFSLLPGWTSVDFLMLAFGLCLVRARLPANCSEAPMQSVSLCLHFSLSVHSPDPGLFHGL